MASNLLRALFLLTAVGLPAGLAAEQMAGRDDFLDSSIERLADRPGFRCRFEQLMLYTDGGRQRYSGELAVRRPGMFRWQYRQPYEQLYVGNGRDIWHYEPDLMQAERLSNLESVDPVVLRLLDGRMSQADIHVLDREHDSDSGIRRYRIRIGEDAPRIWIGFSEDGELSFIEQQDLLGNTNRMSLSTCSYIAPAADLFSFAPPGGVEVLDMRSNHTAE